MQERSMTVSSGDMFALLNSIKSDDEEDIERKMILILNL